MAVYIYGIIKRREAVNIFSLSLCCEKVYFYDVALLLAIL